MADITVIGSNMYELTTFVDRMPVEGETVEAPEFEMGFGGKGANQAIAAARLGSQVNFITMVGKDEFGRQQLENYRSNGISSEGIGIADGSSGVAPIFVDTSGDNRILIVKGANKQLTPAALDSKKDLIKGSKMVVLQQEIALETNYHAIELAEDYGVPVLLNPAPANDDLNINYVSRVAFFAPNETELATLTGMPTGTLDEVKAAARDLVRRGVGNLIVTMGGKGALWISADQELLVPAVTVEAVDTTGAGDAFIGSFAHYYTQGEDVPTALGHANRYAAISVTRRGTQKAYPTAAELSDLLLERVQV